MGMFDWVYVHDRDDFKCPDGHVIRTLQTYDLSDTLARLCIYESGYVEYTRGLLVAICEPKAYFDGNLDLEIHGHCPSTFCDHYCEFDVEIRDWHLVRVRSRNQPKAVIVDDATGEAPETKH